MLRIGVAFSAEHEESRERAAFIGPDLATNMRDIAALALVEAQDSWRPLSIAPNKTLASLLAMIPPLVLAWMVAQRSASERATARCSS